MPKGASVETGIGRDYYTRRTSGQDLTRHYVGLKVKCPPGTERRSRAWVEFAQRNGQKWATDHPQQIHVLANLADVRTVPDHKNSNSCHSIFFTWLVPSTDYRAEEFFEVCYKFLSRFRWRLHGDWVQFTSIDWSSRYNKHVGDLQEDDKIWGDIMEDDDGPSTGPVPAMRGDVNGLAIEDRQSMSGAASSDQWSTRASVGGSVFGRTPSLGRSNFGLWDRPPAKSSPRGDRQVSFAVEEAGDSSVQSWLGPRDQATEEPTRGRAVELFANVNRIREESESRLAQTAQQLGIENMPVLPRNFVNTYPEEHRICEDCILICRVQPEEQSQSDYIHKAEYGERFYIVEQVTPGDFGSPQTDPEWAYPAVAVESNQFAWLDASAFRWILADPPELATCRSFQANIALRQGLEQEALDQLAAQPSVTAQQAEEEV